MRDEWVFSDMELIRKVVAPAIRYENIRFHNKKGREEYVCGISLTVYNGIKCLKKEII